MKNRVWRKRIGLLVDLAMYLLLIIQMLYVFTGNDVHEWLGIGFFCCLIIHLIIKRRWFVLWMHRKGKLISARRFADLIIIILLICLIVLMVSSMGVSRTLFPGFSFLKNPNLHRILATLALSFAVIHGGMHKYFTSPKRKKVVIGIVIVTLAALALGFYGVPYLNRHLRIVEIDTGTLPAVNKLEWKGDKPLIVYFTRIGNTDFDADVDAVSGASLLISDGELTGNTQFMAARLRDILDCDVRAITLTNQQYPSSYAETCVVGGKEIKNHDRPAIENIDISKYDSVILVYPIWWGTIPAPVATFLEENDFSGKSLYLLATQGSSGFASSTKDVKELLPDTDVQEMVSVYCDDVPNVGGILENCLKENELVK